MMHINIIINNLLLISVSVLLLIKILLQNNIIDMQKHCIYDKKNKTTPDFLIYATILQIHLLLLHHISDINIKQKDD